jgi:anti-sigma regulatory factor (Ser/Thr protein kinase)
MKIHLPAGAWIGNINSFLKSLDTSNDKELRITSHEKWVSLHPFVLCIIVAMGLRLKDKKNLHFNKMEAKSRHYLERMGVFRLLNLDSKMNINEHEESGRFIPIQIIKSSKQLEEFIRNMIPLLHRPDKSQSIEYVISELVRNVLEHSYSENGAIVCAQYYTQQNKIRIGVVDIGIGIKSSLKNYTPKNDLQAISLALQPGITGTTTKIGGSEQNAGAGLFFIKSLIKLSREFFLIYSGDSMYKLLKTPKNQTIKFISDPLKDHYSSEDNLPYWNGTVVAIDLCLDEEINFDNFLDMIREVYSKSRKELNKKRYKKPRFI